MKKLIFIVPVLIIAAAAIYLIATSANKSPLTQTSDKLKIVAVENFYGQIAAQIGGPKVVVTSLLANLDVDPHEYDATATDARAVNDASIVIKNGLGYDTFVDNLLVNGPAKKVIDVGEIAKLADGDNPHIWYNSDYIKLFVSKLHDQLIQLDPENRTTYQTNYINFIDALDEVENICQEIKLNYNGVKVIATEPVADYLLIKCGLVPLQSGFQKAIEEGTDPSITDISNFENILKTKGAAVFIYNSQTPTAITEKEKSEAKRNGIPFVGVSETMPADLTYISWMQKVLIDLQTALKQ